MSKTTTLPKFRTAYDSTDDHPGLDFGDEPSLTKQAHKDECDVNFILKNALAKGELPGMIAADARYGDFTSPLSYQDSLNLVMHAQEQFAALPSKVRNRFANDPTQFLGFVQDPRNASELVEMGLANPPPPGATPPAPAGKLSPSVEPAGQPKGSTKPKAEDA